MPPRFEGKSCETQFLGIESRQENERSDEHHEIAANVMFAQMSAAKGMQLFRKRAVAAMFEERNQLNDVLVLEKWILDALSRKQKKNALRATNLIKEKRSGVVKGRAVADGGPQRACIPREEATSPTASTKSLMASLVINAFEERDVATFDVPRARLNADMPSGKFVPLKLEGELVDIVCKVNPECKEDARHRHGKKVPHLRILKALCGCVESALSWCEMRVSTLKDVGFVINPRVTSALQTRMGTHQHPQGRGALSTRGAR